MTINGGGKSPLLNLLRGLKSTPSKLPKTQKEEIPHFVRNDSAGVSSRADFARGLLLDSRR